MQADHDRKFTVVQDDVPFTTRPCVGRVSKHPDGYFVYVTAGAYEVRGRISNFWYWRRLNSDGSLGEKGHGYGW